MHNTQFSVDDDTVRHRLQPALFLTESLNELLVASLPDPATSAVKPAALRGKWGNDTASVNNITAYEQFLHTNVFKVVLNSYPQRSAAFISSSVASSSAFSVILSIGRSLTHRLAYPIVSSDSVKAALPPPRYVPHPAKENVQLLDPELPHFILQFYLAYQLEYTALQFIPSIASFYNSLLDTFGHRITIEQAQQHSVPELLDWLQHQFFDSSKVATSVQYLRDAYAKFSEDWNSVRSVLAGMELCGDAHNNRRFESDIPIVDEHGPLFSALVNIALDGIPQMGAIPRLLDDLLTKQSRLLELRGGEGVSQLNAHGLLWDTHTFASTDVSWVVQHREHARSFFIGYQFSPEQFNDLAITAARFPENGAGNWSPASLQVDIASLERAVRCFFIYIYIYL